MLDINYMGAVHAIRGCLQSMKARRKGKIAVVSSVAGFVGLFGYTGYSASKFALRGFAEALQMEVKPFNISVTVSFPPDTDTPCLEEENKIKPTETKLIGETAGVFKPEDVAESIMKSILVRSFCHSIQLPHYDLVVIKHDSRNLFIRYRQGTFSRVVVLTQMSLPSCVLACLP